MRDEVAAKSAPSAEKETREKLALACRILGTEGHDDTDLGHVSVRAPGQPDRMIIKGKGLCLSEIHEEDLLTVDFSYRKIDGRRDPHGELPIHIEIYRARKDVRSIVHTHPLYATAFSSTNQILRPISNEAVLFAKPLPYFDEETDLIVAPEQGVSLAQKLGDAKAALMKNHGHYMTLPAAVYRPRNPQSSDYYRCGEDYFDTFIGIYDEYFSRQYGFRRPYVEQVIYRYLDCGNLRNGFAA